MLINLTADPNSGSSMVAWHDDPTELAAERRRRSVRSLVVVLASVLAVGAYTKLINDGVPHGPWRSDGPAWIVAALLVAVALAYPRWTNPRVIRELRDDPQGERAQKVMLLTLPSGKAIPVNYLRDGDTVYAAADFPWWREVRGEGGRGSVLIRGETLSGQVRAVKDDPELREAVFVRLRPSAPRWLGTLVVIELD